jgi:predicted nicotinamide N-methyase
MFLATFVDSSDWGISESLMLADENFKSPNSIDMLLRTDVFFEVRRYDK